MKVLDALAMKSTAQCMAAVVGASCGMRHGPMCVSGCVVTRERMCCAAQSSCWSTCGFMACPVLQTHLVERNERSRSKASKDGAAVPDFQGGIFDETTRESQGSGQDSSHTPQRSCASAARPQELQHERDGRSHRGESFRYVQQSCTNGLRARVCQEGR